MSISRSLNEAKQCFKDALASRINTYEARLKKSYYTQLIEYLNTDYGKKGYERTKDFLAKMDAKDISRIEDLINLTRQYVSKGTKLPLLLKKCALEVCGYTQAYLNVVEEQLLKKINNTVYSQKCREHGCRETAIKNIHHSTINYVYNIIIQSNDCGKSYKDTLEKEASGLNTLNTSIERVNAYLNNNNIDISNSVNLSALSLLVSKVSSTKKDESSEQKHKVEEKRTRSYSR